MRGRTYSLLSLNWQNNAEFLWVEKWRHRDEKSLSLADRVEKLYGKILFEFVRRKMDIGVTEFRVSVPEIDFQGDASMVGGVTVRKLEAGLETNFAGHSGICFF